MRLIHNLPYNNFKKYYNYIENKNNGNINRYQ